MGSARFAGCTAFALTLACAVAAQAEPTSESVKVARKRFQEGVAAADARNYEAARIAFQQAYALKPHASVLRNLGQAELKTGRYLDAARHLSTFIRDTTFGSANERESAKKSLAEAETKLGKLLLEVDVIGADVTVDGEVAGRSPFGADPVYVDPGPRIVRVQKDGYEPYEQVQNFEADRAVQLKIALRPVGPPPTEAASVSRVTSTLIEPPFVPLPPPDRTRPAGPSPMTVSDDRIETGGSHARTVVLISGAGLTAIAAGVWVGFALQGASLKSDISKQLTLVEAQFGKNGCEANAASDLCVKLDDTLSRRNRANTVAAGGMIATGVLGAATAAALFLWPTPHRTGALTPGVAPALAGQGATFWLTGSY